MVYLRRLVEIPAGLGFPPGYFLKLREELKVTRCPGGGYFLSEYDVCYRLSEDYRKRLNDGREFSAGVALTPEKDAYGRWGLRRSARE